MRFGAYVYFVLILLTACGGNQKTEKQTVHLAAAANLRYALEDVNAAFEKKTGIKVQMSVAGSGKLSAQIKNGAPYDVFISADKKYPEYLYHNKLAFSPPKELCKSVLVIWTFKQIALDSSLSKLCQQKIKSVALANPETAPFGQAAIQALKSAKSYECIQGKIIFTENVSQVSQYVLNGNTEIGFTSKSIVLSKYIKGKGQWVTVDSTLYDAIIEYALLTKNAQNKSNAFKYYDFLFSNTAKNILKQNGYDIK